MNDGAGFGIQFAIVELVSCEFPDVVSLLYVVNSNEYFVYAVNGCAWFYLRPLPFQFQRLLLPHFVY